MAFCLFGARPLSEPTFIYWTLRNKLQWNINQDTKLLIYENALIRIICCQQKTAAMCSMPQCVKIESILVNLLNCTPAPVLHGNSPVASWSAWSISISWAVLDPGAAHISSTWGNTWWYGVSFVSEFKAWMMINVLPLPCHSVCNNIQCCAVRCSHFSRKSSLYGVFF